MADEFERIRRLRSLFRDPPSGVRLGIGDDAAVLDVAPGEQLVWTIDACVENVHFRPDIVGWEDVGVRSFMAAASDLAAMAARPAGALSALTLPADVSDEELMAIGRGQETAARSIGTAVIGGNLSGGAIVTVTTTLAGWTTRAPRRNGARPGDVVALSGEVGWAAAGLRLLIARPELVPEDDAQRHALQAFLRPVARIDEGLWAGPRATSLIDVSDGLAQDASHVAEASGLRIDLDTSLVVTPDLVAFAGRLGVDASRLALHGGEDFALLGTFAPGDVPDGFLEIGRCREGTGVWADGREIALAGHDHFRR